MVVEKISSPNQILVELCRLRRQWGLYVSYGHEELYDEIVKAVPFLDAVENLPHLWDGAVYVFFDTKEDCDAHFSQVVGDDGPTPSNPYDGPARAYALTCDPNGTLLNENT